MGKARGKVNGDENGKLKQAILTNGKEQFKKKTK